MSATTAMDTPPKAAAKIPEPAANRVFVLGSDGEALAPCCVQRAWKLIRAGRVRKRWYRPELWAIQLKDRDRSNATPANLEIRCKPGVRTSGFAVVMTTPTEDRVVFQLEITHRSDIGKRLKERKAHRRRRRGQVSYREPRFDNRRRPEDWSCPTIESIVSNQVHTIARLQWLSGAQSVTVQTGKFDTHKILRPGIKGIEYQQGPLYKTHTRAYVAEQWNHRCAYCDAKDWEAARPFNLDHVAPVSAGGPTNIRNLVWSCRRCNQRKGTSSVEDFLKDDPPRLEKISKTTTGSAAPLAAAGVYAQVCKQVVKRVRGAGVKVEETSGADTSVARACFKVAKTPANDAACCRATKPVSRLREPARLKAVGHGRRKQAKGLHKAEYTAWRHLKPAERKRTPCPHHAVRPNHVNGIRSGDIVELLHGHKWIRGRAQVEAGSKRVHISTTATKCSTSKPSRMRRIAPRNGYRKSN